MKLTLNTILGSLLAFFLFLLLAIPIKAYEEKVNIYFFWSKGCPHCTQEKPFLESLLKKYSQLELSSFEISTDPQAAEILQKVANKLNADVKGVPFTVIGEHYFIGWYDETTTGKAIEEAVICGLENGCPNIVENLIPSSTKKNITIPEKLSLPIIGKINTKNLSLPVLTFVIALLDGFNPCAMWTLLFLISLLLGMKDRKRMWILGAAFIMASSFIYFLFMSAWLNLFLFLGFIGCIRIIIGITALTFGFINLRNYLVKKDSGCEIVKDKKRKMVFEKIKGITQKDQFILALLGIILLAFAVNLVELICSAGLPAIYTQILTLNHLPNWQYYLYLIFYIIIFMLDDLIVFFVAMTTLKAIGIENKYSRYSKLIGGIVITIIGILMLLKPELLMFG